MADIVDQVWRTVEAACAAEANVFGYGIWTHHITKVAENARKLAAAFGADVELVELAALLHDYASVKDEALYPDHHIHGSIEAETLLRGYGYPQERIDTVKHAIEAHRGSVAIRSRSPEALCLRNADAIAHVQNVPSLLHLAYVEHGMGVEEGGALWVRAKLERSWKKLSPEAQTQVREEFEAALKVLPGTR